jgi:hypothetical protein
MTVCAQGFTAFAVEGQCRRIHKDQRQVGEQVSAPVKQGLFDHILYAPRRQTAIGFLFHFLAQPGHGSVKMVQL